MNFCFVIDELLAASSQPGKNRRLPIYLSLYKENSIKVLFSLNKQIEIDPGGKEQFKVYWHKLNDYELPSLHELNDIVDVILKHIRKKEAVNVNCSTGIGRSSLVITAVMMKYFNIPLLEARERVMEHRYVNLDDGAHELLLDYEEWVLEPDEDVEESYESLESGEPIEALS